MNNATIARLAVCSWSLQPSRPHELIAQLKETNIFRTQLALDPLRENPGTWNDTANLFRQNGITIVSGMFGCVGEDYSTLESIRDTGGIAPDNTWPQNLVNLQASAAIAAQLGLSLVSFHAGFLPHDEEHPDFSKMLRRIAEVTHIFSSKKISLALETGQETAPALASFLRKLNLPNLGVNFDPANIILYDKGEPLEAFRTLRPWIRQIHIKDAQRTTAPGTWGVEVAAGKGDVNWPGFFDALKHENFSGDLVIERETGNQRIADVCVARDLVHKFIRPD